MSLLIKETAKLFKTPEQWDNYLELTALKDDLVETWQNSVKKQVLDFFRKPENKIKGCSFSESSCFDWYLEGYQKAFAICVWGYRDFGLWIDTDEIDCEKANELVKEEKYKKIWSCFRNDEEIDEDWIFYEKGNFSFEGALNNRNFNDNEEIIWCANKYTKEYCQQIKEKLELFCTKENRLLLKKLYQKVKKTSNLQSI